MHKPVPTMTVAEAIAAGYSQCLQDGNTYVEAIEDVEIDDLNEYTYWISQKESAPYQIAESDIKDILKDHVAAQDWVADEDGEIVDIIDAIPDAEFEAITKLVNDKLAEKVYWPSTDIQLIP